MLEPKLTIAKDFRLNGQGIIEVDISGIELYEFNFSLFQGIPFSERIKDYSSKIVAVELKREYGVQPLISLIGEPIIDLGNQINYKATYRVSTKKDLKKSLEEETMGVYEKNGFGD